LPSKQFFFVKYKEYKHCAKINVIYLRDLLLFHYLGTLWNMYRKTFNENDIDLTTQMPTKILNVMSLKYYKLVVAFNKRWTI
jgi:hypothetical protein